MKHCLTNSKHQHIWSSKYAKAFPPWALPGPRWRAYNASQTPNQLGRHFSAYPTPLGASILPPLQTGGDIVPNIFLPNPTGVYLHKHSTAQLYKTQLSKRVIIVTVLTKDTSSHQSGTSSWQKNLIWSACANYKNSPWPSGEQLFHLLHTSYATRVFGCHWWQFACIWLCGVGDWDGKVKNAGAKQQTSAGLAIACAGIRHRWEQMLREQLGAGLTWTPCKTS